MSSPEKHLSAALLSHKPYTPGIQPNFTERVIKLNTNENPFPPSEKVREKVLSEIESLNLYPSPRSSALRDCVANLHSLAENQVIIGNGSDDLLNLCVRCFADENLKVGMLAPSYSLYETLASIQGAKVVGISFANENFELPVEGIVSSGVNLFFLTSPHAPSGKEYGLAELEEVLQGFSGIMVIDEAYADFAGHHAIPLLSKYPNLIITRTLSKSYSLAGLRVGYALASPALVEVLDQAREVYNLDRLAQAGALAALSDREYFQSTQFQIIKLREGLREEFTVLGW
ncbi:MAG: aminotransferase class I/II-fold pyridoxal phosphate-dependent enzyme, partial [Verrucomicrobiota bacterium]|nr:aminotransferase class I/II-fold pyridoxal phosphate-dependent enzyme [Verrucomicrobiota bacterium]